MNKDNLYNNNNDDNADETSNLLSENKNNNNIELNHNNKHQSETETTSFKKNVIDFSFAFFGLQISYLLWGMMQELIMNTTYNPTPLSPSGKFPSATFCVFSNRFLALIISSLVCYFKHGKLTSSVPLLAFTPCAFSNTASSWAQYKALNYVSFSLQTVFKSSKVIPVMLMGTFLRGTTYTLVEYFEAIFISIGVLIFSTSSSNWNTDGDNNTTYQIFGIFLLTLYVTTDAFTSQWQSKLFKNYGKIDHYQMMFGVNFSAIIMTFIALITSGELVKVIEFFRYNPSSITYNIITAITSSSGQFAVFYTIKRFGPIVFTIIMTTRQMLSIILSNYYFGHQMDFNQYLGAFMVFLVIFYSSYRRSNKSEGPSNKSEGSSNKSESQSSVSSVTSRKEISEIQLSNFKENDTVHSRK